jgi:hypothetical protein
VNIVRQQAFKHPAAADPEEVIKDLLSNVNFCYIINRVLKPAFRHFGLGRVRGDRWVPPREAARSTLKACVL